MHILFVCHEYPPTLAGGIGPAVATIARGLLRSGWKVSVIGFDKSLEMSEDEYGVRIFRFPWPKSDRYTRWWKQRDFLHKKILEIHSRDPIDLIEWPDYGGWYWRDIPGVANVVKVHGTTISHRIHGISQRRQLATEFFELRTLRQIKNWIGVSEWFNEEWKAYASVTPDREEIVYNPFDIDVFSPIQVERDPNLIMYAGGLKRRKGVLSLASAASIFLASRPRARLLFIGFPADVAENEIFQRAGEAVAARIEIKHYVSQKELAKYMSQASIYAMPSLYESCGNTWIEAAACELPVIGSISSCGPEVVADGETGLLADPTSPEDVAKKIIQLIDDPEYARKLGQTGRRRAVERFSLDIAVSKSKLFYESCINS